MLEKVKNLLKVEKKEQGFIRLKIPKHIAFVTRGKTIWAKKHEAPIEEAYKKSFTIVKNTLSTTIKLNIPIVTFYLLSTNIKDLEEFSVLMDSLTDFFDELASDDLIQNNKVKVSILGKWYDLPGRVVDSVKNVMNTTKEHENFHLNFCLNYDGQDEIIDAIKLISRKVKADKIDPDSIEKETIKENIYSSYFMPPDLIIINGPRKATSGILLWDSPNSQIYFTNKLWPDFDKTEFMDAIKEYQKGK